MNGRIIESIKIQLKKNKLAKIYIGIIIVFIIAALLAPLSPYDPTKIDIVNKLSKPNLKNVFGTDSLGRDYFTRALYGGRISLAVGFMSMIVSIVIGTLVGTISGYFGGVVDSIIMRFIDILMSIPSFFLILIVNAYLKPGIMSIVLIIGLFGWMGIARIVRSETLTLKEREFVLCSKTLGSGPFWILFKHIIPNVMSTVIVASTINIATAILTESSLSFLGLGIQQPFSSWGSMLKDAQSFMSDAPYLAIFPGLFILLTVLSFNVLGDILRAASNPMEDI
ncbi:ABC transporter permease [Brassicibacter mesophilus]|uniref:ABC transporter permease n=1 Tax=Brassicibacter mesophilus TaxID=745119 RepID=UPI003D251470